MEQPTAQRIHEARSLMAQQETLTSDQGVVKVKPSPDKGLSTIHTSTWSGDYEHRGHLFVLTARHQGRAPISIGFAMPDRSLILDYLTGL